MKLRYAAHLTPGLAASGASPRTRAEVIALEDAAERWLRETISLRSAGTRCAGELDGLVGPDANDDLEAIAVWSCEGDVADLAIDYRPFAGRIDDWQSIASLAMGGAVYSTVFTDAAPQWIVGAAGQSGGAAPEDSSAVRFARLGIWHIWTGLDHLLFLFAVLLAGGGLLRLVAVATSFTVAHSLTLAAAATGFVRLAAEPVEALIAASIVFVALENVAGRGADRRVLVTFGFGLVHGLGFAGVLSEAALPPGEILVPLLAFNAGVELGQLVVILAMAPLLALLARERRRRAIVAALSALIAFAGAFWAVERIAAMLGR